MKLILLLALHGAHASLRHKATKNAVDAETTQSLFERQRRNLRFGNTGGDGCCFPYFAPWAPGPGGPPDKRMLTAGMPSFEEYRKSHD